MNACCLCGSKKNLLQHAINYDDDNMADDNVVILCNNCHHWIHDKPEYKEECARLLYKYLEMRNG